MLNTTFGHLSRSQGQDGKSEADPWIREPSPATVSPAESIPPAANVHIADIDGPDVEAPHRNRWNTAVSLQCAAPERG